VTKRIWMDSWQMQCCGTPFEVGSVVTWDLVPVGSVRRGHLASFLGDEVANEISDWEEHHGGGGDDEPEGEATTGTVRAIELVYYEIAPPDAGRRDELVLVPGSTVSVSRSSAQTWEPTEEGLHHRGYIIDVEDTP
jgi:hypothetical protein